MSSLDQDPVTHDHFSFRKIALPKTESNSSCRLTFDEWNKRTCNTYKLKCEEFAEYKKAMLELAKDAPEHVYELSLRDLVELPTITRIERENNTENEERSQKNKSNISFHKHLMRSVSLKSRRVLNVFFPICADTMIRNVGSSDNLLEHVGRTNSSGSCSSSNSSSSTKSFGGSSSCGSSKSCNGVRGLVKASSDRRQNGGVQINCGRQEAGCYPFFTGQNYKSKSKRN